MSIGASCSQAGVGRTTHYDWYEKYADYAEEVDAAIRHDMSPHHHITQCRSPRHIQYHRGISWW